MNEPADWVLGYAQQANADFRAWELYCVMCQARDRTCYQSSSAGRLTESSMNWILIMSGPYQSASYGFPNFEKIFGQAPPRAWRG